jgi:hypothetical protein
MGRTIAVVFASLGLLAGCPSDDGGGEDTDTDASTGSGATMSSTTAMTVTASGSGTSSSTTDDTTTDATTGTSMPETTSTASMTDTAETDSATGTGTGTGTGGGTDTGGEATYPPCDPLGMPQCPKPWEGCYIGSTITHNVCTMACENPEEDCPAPNGGDAVPACGGPAMDQCVLDCAGDAACPDGMECVPVDPGMTIFRCMWPVE